MRLGVLDVGSNTVHLLLVDAHRGAHPWPAHSEKAVLRLAEQIRPNGALTKAGADALVRAAADAQASARRLQRRRPAGVRHVGGPRRHELAGGPEPGATRPAYGCRCSPATTRRGRRSWPYAAGSAGRPGGCWCFDIGGGSLEIAAGIDETPDIAMSLPLGAGRLTREWLGVDREAKTPPPSTKVDELEEYVDKALDPAVEKTSECDWDRPVATSKTFRTLARLAGAAPSGAGLYIPRMLTRTGLRQVIGFIRHIAPSELSELEGVSGARAHQLLAGAIVAEATMRRIGVEQVEICPWALREGVILRRLDQLESA